MNASVLKFALGFGGVLAVAGCGGQAAAGDADATARELMQCLDGRAFWFAPNVKAALVRSRLGAVRADTPVLTKGGGDAGFVEAEIPLDYAVDAAGTKVLAARGVCAPGVRCFPSAATAELYPSDSGGYDFSLEFVDTFGPYKGGRVIALAPVDVHRSATGGCR